MSHSILAALALGLMQAAGPQPGHDVTKPDVPKPAVTKPAVTTQEVPEPATPVALPDVALPPELDRVLRDYERAWRAGDTAALAALFTEDGFVLPGNTPPIRGRGAIQASYGKQTGAVLRLRALAFASKDTIGYIIGAYSFGDKPGDVGKFTLTLRRAPGKPWLIFSDMDSTNAAPKRKSAADTSPPAAPAAAEH